MKIQRRLPKSLRKNPCERAMPLWTSEPESTEWFDTFNLDGEELIGFEPEPKPQPSKQVIWLAEKKKQDRKAAKKTEKRAEQPKPAVNGYVVLDGKRHTIAVGTPASYEVVFDEGLDRNVYKDGKKQKDQLTAAQMRFYHTFWVVEQLWNLFVDTTGELLIAELVVAGPGNMKARLMMYLPAPLYNVATSTTTSQSGKSGLWELMQGMLLKELNRERERLGLKAKKAVPGKQAGRSQPQKQASKQKKQPATPKKEQGKKGKKGNKRCN